MPKSKQQPQLSNERVVKPGEPATFGVFQCGGGKCPFISTETDETQFTVANLQFMYTDFVSECEKRTIATTLSGVFAHDGGHVAAESLHTAVSV